MLLRRSELLMDKYQQLTYLQNGSDSAYNYLDLSSIGLKTSYEYVTYLSIDTTPGSGSGWRTIMGGTITNDKPCYWVENNNFLSSSYNISVTPKPSFTNSFKTYTWRTVENSSYLFWWKGSINYTYPTYIEKLAQLKIYQSSILLYNLVSCIYKKSLGYYDKINNQFYPIAGSFIAGKKCNKKDFI